MINWWIKKKRERRLREHRLPDYAPIKNKTTPYGYDPQAQNTLTDTDTEMDINVHDPWAVESTGPIQDRTKQHLGSTDACIIQYRHTLRKAIEQLAVDETHGLPMINGHDVKKMIGPQSNDTTTNSSDWRRAYEESDNARRNACNAWDAS